MLPEITKSYQFVFHSSQILPNTSFSASQDRTEKSKIFSTAFSSLQAFGKRAIRKPVVLHKPVII
jgi:hypothetical protein